jgi:23S rRNA-/tRNA-specific pseudouridylate synthase
VLARPNAGGARPATTHYAALAIAGEATLLCLGLATGRMHQIRAHAARARLPLLGDRRYGGPPTVVDASGRVHEIGRIALHCQRVELHEWLAAEAPASDELGPLWQQLGGTDAAWALASGWGRAAKLMP